VIVGYHIIFSSYGFWLPNDPRGSWSEFVGSWELFRYGPATKTNQTRSLAYRAHDRTLRKAAKSVLKYPPVHFTGLQARAVARGFAGYVERTGLPVWAGESAQGREEKAGVVVCGSPCGMKRKRNFSFSIAEKDRGVPPVSRDAKRSASGSPPLRVAANHVSGRTSY
jgi:hypothetical protein